MKSNLKSFVKIYVFELIVVGILLTSYAIYLSNTKKASNLIIELVIGIISMLFLGLLYGNHFQKKGLIIGLLVGVIHIFLFKIILLLANGSFQFNFLHFSIYTIACGLGGMLGIVFKKII